MQPAISEQMQQTVQTMMPQFGANSFVQGIATGDLPRAVVINYVQQDNIYLQRFLNLYQRVLGQLSPELLANTEHDIRMENGAHQVLLQAAQTTTKEIMTPWPPTKNVTQTYLQHMESAAKQSAFIGLASMQACPAVYVTLANQLVAKDANVPTNPFAAWINFYAGTDDGFDQTMFHELDQLSPTVANEDRQEALVVFQKSCEYELAFFAQAEEEN
ncbi:TenA family protein [Fructilactobacillus hinvesii]|uniref:Aminopyrimidine aminohydrolase n=1 Tax=Fructilactobacillus hinvesii TaxID=2940300 RepID=A0ABY5BSH4_9LACO|nr:TenA family protein [Fructilactobacillus hinvesii]USS88017.1 TenA family protein [Fructilactobacillus hinvesii]